MKLRQRTAGKVTEKKPFKVLVENHEKKKKKKNDKYLIIKSIHPSNIPSFQQETIH